MNKKKYPVSGKPVPPFAYRTELNYFYTFIGPVNREVLDNRFPNGEGHMRSGIQNIYRNIFGPEGSCSSGWGVTPQQKDDASYALYDDDVKKQLIRSYYAEGKPIPRGLRAWELYFQEEHAKEAGKICAELDKKVGNIIDKKKKLIKTNRA